MAAPTALGRNDPDKAWAYSKDVAWYRRDLSEETIGIARPILEEYSKIPRDEVADWIKEVRDKAWQVYPYGTIGMFGFLTMNLPSLPNYGELLAALKAGKTFLDVGCCVGQELRKLVYDGVPSENLAGVDLHQGFLDVGYDLFRDRATLRSRLFAADIFDEGGEGDGAGEGEVSSEDEDEKKKRNKLRDLDGTIDIIHAGSFFHLFDWDQQVVAARRCVDILRPAPGSMLVGRQAGDVHAGQKSRPGKLGSRYRHNAASWARLWAQVAAETGTDWDVRVRELEDREYFRDTKGGGREYGDWNRDTTRRIEFVFTRK